VSAHPEFADRRTAKQIDGQTVDGWFTEDFTLDELRTLRAVERIPALRRATPGSTAATRCRRFGEILDLAERLTGELGRTIGVYPETKTPQLPRLDRAATGA